MDVWGMEMAHDTITFELGGRVAIDKFKDGIGLLQRLVTALSQNRNVTWFVEDLQTSSAITTLRGEAEDPRVVDQIVREYAQVGSTLERHEAPQHSRQVDQAARAIQSFAESIEYVRFETPEADYTVRGNGSVPQPRALWTSVGTVTGRVQTLSNRGKLRFNLYDTVHDRAVSCYLQQGQEELMREAWGRRVTVSGTISRERTLGRPVSIRNILSIDILEDIAQGSYLHARGAVLWQEGDKMPEEVIRELRDA